MGTLVALLVYFWRDWSASSRPGLRRSATARSRDDPDRRLAWLLVAIATIPAADRRRPAERLLRHAFRDGRDRRGHAGRRRRRSCGWPIDRARRTQDIERLDLRGALGIGVAQALALFPGISRSGITISAGLFPGLTREAAARFSFLMATPITAGAVLCEGVKLVRGEAGATLDLAAARRRACSPRSSPALAAIAFLLRYLRTHIAGDLRGLPARPRGDRRRRLPGCAEGARRWRS